MASPQVENGHIDIANEIADKLCSYRLSGQEWQIIWVVLRKTWGWLQDPSKKCGNKKKMDSIALSQFAELTGIDRRKCHAILTKLTEKRVLVKSVTQKGDKSIISYGFQKNYELWKVSPKKVTVTQKGNKPVTQKGAHKRYIKETLYCRVVEYLNKKTGSDFKPTTKTTQEHINARVKEGFKPEDFKTVIDFKCKQWIGDPEKQEYLRPQTLFNSKFEAYLNAARRNGTQPAIMQTRKTPEQIEAEKKEALS